MRLLKESVVFMNYLGFALVLIVSLAVLTGPACAEGVSPEDSSGFVRVSDAAPDVILEIRYYSTYNFVGERVDGYGAPVALLTREAAHALKAASDDAVSRGYRLKVYDAYRPMTAQWQLSDGFVQACAENPLYHLAEPPANRITFTWSASNPAPIISRISAVAAPCPDSRSEPVR